MFDDGGFGQEFDDGGAKEVANEAEKDEVDVTPLVE